MREVLKFMQVEVLDVEPGGVNEREAQTLLGPGVLHDLSRRGTAWTTILETCLDLTRSRSGIDRAGLQRALELEGILVEPAQSYRADIERLRARSTTTRRRLAHLATFRAGATEVRIDRPVIGELRRAAANGSHLVVGEPGAGKSAALYELAAELIGQGEDVVYLAVDDPTGLSPGSLEEQRLQHEFMDVLSAWTGPGPGYLLIDGLDIARVQGTASTYRHLLREVASRDGRWRAVCSIRKFDLRYSPELQELFADPQPQGVPGEFQDSEFARLRHLNVPSFAADELAQLRQQAPALWELVLAAPAALQALLRVPFNLRLAAELLELGSTVADLTPIRTQLELFDRYWQRRVIGDTPQGDANEAVLRTACEQMVAGRTLQAARSAVAVQPDASAALDAMLSAHVLVEWQPTADARPERRVVAFAHHLLFDYAVMTLLLAGMPGTAAARLRADPELALVVRPSLVLHFHRLWTMDPDHARFWDETLTLAADDRTPEIAKLLGPLVAVELAEELPDLDQYCAALERATPADVAATTSVLRHLAGALNLSLEIPTWLSPARATCWCAMAERLSQRLDDDTSYPLRTIVLSLCDHNDRLGIADLQRLGRAARRLLEFAWAHDPRDPHLVAVGLEAVCRTFASEPASSAALLRRALQADHLAKYGFQEMPRLAHELPQLVGHDPELVGDVYVAVLSYDESRTDPAPMGSSKILSLVSNIRQDFDNAKWQLGKFFPTYLEQAPLQATEALLKVLESLAASGQPRSPEEGFEFCGSPAGVRDDRTNTWDWGEFGSHDELVQMLDTLQRYITARAAQDDRPLLQDLVGLVARKSRSSTVWRRLLVAGAEHPTTLGILLVPLAWAIPVLASPATAFAAVPFVEAVFPLLDPADRTRVEHAAMALPAQFQEQKKDPTWGQHARNRLIERLDRAHLTTDAAVALLDELEAQERDAPAAPSVESQSVDQGSDAKHAATLPEEDSTAKEGQRLRELISPIKAFLNAESPQRASVDITAALQALLEALVPRTSTEPHSAVSTQAWELISDTAGRLAQDDGISCDEYGSVVLEVLLAASRHPRPLADDAQELEANTVLTLTPAPRVNAANGLMALAAAPGCATEQVLEAIERFAADPAPRVRFWVAANLNRLYQVARARMWTLAHQFADHEPTTGVLHALVQGALGRLGGADPDRVAELTSAIYSRKGGTNRTLDQACLDLLAALWVDRGVPVASQALDRSLQAGQLSADRWGTILHTVRSRLTHGATADADSASDQVRARSFDLFQRIFTRSLDTLSELQPVLRTAQPSEPDVARARDAAQILDALMRELYFASGAYDRQSSSESPARVPQPVHERFYQQAGALLDQVAEVGLPSATHHLIETLEFFVPVDPRGVFLRIDRAIDRGGREGGYQLESLAVSAVVRLVKRYLADYRELLHQDSECRRALQRILDTFVAVGWPEARRLAYQLDELFR